MHVGVLFAGIPRKPFHVVLEHPFEATLGDLAVCTSISEQLAQNEPFVEVGVPNAASAEPYHCYMRFYDTVVTTPSGQRRFMRLSDSAANHCLTTALQATGPLEYAYRPLQGVESTFLRPDRELRRGMPIVPLLASLVGDEQELFDWGGRGDEIHIIVSLWCRAESGQHVPQYACRCLSRSWKTWMDPFAWPREPALRYCCGNGKDAAYHQFGAGRYRSGEMLHLPAGYKPVPPGSVLTVTRGFCRFRRQGLRDVCSFPVGNAEPSPFTRSCPEFPIARGDCPHVPLLRKLAGEAALVHLLRTDTPLFVDSVDCVVEAHIESEAGGVLHENVICYFKFLCCRRNNPSQLKVNPQMVELLDWVVMARALPDADDPSSEKTANPPRLMVFVDGNSQIDPSCLPTEFPSIRVSKP